jgi:hypothetical protein
MNYIVGVYANSYYSERMYNWLKETYNRNFESYYSGINGAERIDIYFNHEHEAMAMKIKFSQFVLDCTIKE